MSYDEYYEGQDIIDILQGNRFAAELAYSFDGFNVGFNRVPCCLYLTLETLTSLVLIS